MLPLYRSRDTRHYSIRNFFYGKDTCINMVADEDDLYIGVVFHEHLVERREITEAAVILDHDRPIGSTCTCVSLPQTAYTSKKSNRTDSSDTQQRRISKGERS